MTQLTVLGGSSVSTPGLVLALRAMNLPIRLVLHGRTKAKLEAVAKACRTAAQGSAVTVEWNTDLAQCLTGADLILNQVRVGGLEGRRFDEQFPTTLGLIGEETIGAGGFCNALRTIPVVLETCRAIRAHAPGALVINLTNPSSLVQQAMERFGGVRVVTGCDVPATLSHWAHQLVGAPEGSLEIDYLGTNHLGWVTAARDLAEHGRNRLPEALEHLDRLPSFPLDRDWVRSLGALPGAYLRYYYHRDRCEPKAPVTRSRADELLAVEADLLDRFANLAADSSPALVDEILARRRPHWYAEIIAPLVAALSGPRPQRMILQVSNRATVSGIGPHSIIELPVLVNQAGVQPLTPPELPPDCMALLKQNAAYEDLAVEAIVAGDRALAVRALVLNPFVGTVDRAKAVVNAAWPSDQGR
jgi:6-phospho-beta-glucosidase